MSDKHDNKLDARDNNNNDDWRKKVQDELKPENMGKRFNKLRNGKYRFSFWYFLLVIVVLAILNFLFLRTPDEVIEFSVFKEKVEQGEIRRVKMTPSFYYGMTYTSGEYAEQMVNSLTQRLQGGGDSSSREMSIRPFP